MSVPVKLDNPYWDEVQKFPNSDMRWNKDRFEPDQFPGLLESIRLSGSRGYDVNRSRTGMVRKYAWAIPSNRTIHWLADKLAGRDVVEMGAGRGYWAYMLKQMGIQVLAMDQVIVGLGEENHYCNKEQAGYEELEKSGHQFHEIWRGEPKDLTAHGDKVLFLCWPPYGEDMAYQSLLHYSGDTVIYIGEGEGGCTGDDQFHEALARDWNEVDSHTPIQWAGIHDHIYVYERSDKSVIQEQP